MPQARIHLFPRWRFSSMHLEVFLRYGTVGLQPEPPEVPPLPRRLRLIGVRYGRRNCRVTYAGEARPTIES